MTMGRKPGERLMTLDESAGAEGGRDIREVKVSRCDHRLESDIEIRSAKLCLLQQYIKRTTCTTRPPIYMP